MPLNYQVKLKTPDSAGADEAKALRYQQYVRELTAALTALEAKKPAMDNELNGWLSHDYSQGQFTGTNYDEYMDKVNGLRQCAGGAVDSPHSANIRAVHAKIRYYNSQISALQKSNPDLKLKPDNMLWK